MPLGEELHTCRQAPTMSNLHSAAEVTKGWWAPAIGLEPEEGWLDSVRRVTTPLLATSSHLKKQSLGNCTWYNRSLIPALRGQRQEDFCEFSRSLVYIAGVLGQSGKSGKILYIWEIFFICFLICFIFIFSVPLACVSSPSSIPIIHKCSLFIYLGFLGCFVPGFLMFWLRLLPLSMWPSL